MGGRANAGATPSLSARRVVGSADGLHEPMKNAGPILVLDPSTVTALAAVRGLGRAGWRVIVAGSERRSRAVAGQSRYVERYYRIPSPHGPAAPFRAAMDRLLTASRPLVVVAGSDPTAVRLHDMALPVPTVPLGGSGFATVTDKLELGAVCERAGVRYPETWVPGVGEDPPYAEPLIVKPRRSAVANATGIAAQTGAAVVHGREAVGAAVARVRAQGLEPIIQRRVERAFKLSASIVRYAGCSTVRITYYVLREFPVAGGVAVATETIDPHQGVGQRAIAAAERVCDNAGYAGIANVEIYGDNRGELCVLEVNARPWGSIWLAEHLGLEVTARAVEGALGLPPRPPVDYPIGRRFHRSIGEVRWLLSRSPERGPRRQLLRTLGVRDVYDVVSMSDPRPVVGMATAIASILEAKVRRLGRID